MKFDLTKIRSMKPRSESASQDNDNGSQNMEANDSVIEYDDGNDAEIELPFVHPIASHTLPQRTAKLTFVPHDSDNLAQLERVARSDIYASKKNPLELLKLVKETLPQLKSNDRCAYEKLVEVFRSNNWHRTARPCVEHSKATALMKKKTKKKSDHKELATAALTCFEIWEQNNTDDLDEKAIAYGKIIALVMLKLQLPDNVIVFNNKLATFDMLKLCCVQTKQKNSREHKTTWKLVELLIQQLAMHEIKVYNE